MLDNTDAYYTIAEMEDFTAPDVCRRRIFAKSDDVSDHSNADSCLLVLKRMQSSMK